MRALVTLAALAVLPLLTAGGAARAGNALVDPTRPATATDTVVTAAEPGAMRVQAIVIRASSRVAIVDGHLVHAGDRIANRFIEEVTPEGVRYSQDGHSHFARLRCLKELPVRRGALPQRELP